MFSLNRFWQYLKSDVIENKVMYLSVIIASFALMILIAAMFCRLQALIPDQYVIKNVFNALSTFVLLLTISLAFWDVTNKGTFLNTVRKPASMFEKYITRVLLFGILFPFMQRIFFAIVEYCRALFIPMFEGDWFMSIYGRVDGEGYSQYFFQIDQAWFPSLIVCLMVVALVLYQSSTFGGVKAFLHFMGSTIFSMVFFVSMILSAHDKFEPVLESLPHEVGEFEDIIAIEVSMILSMCAILPGTILCLKSFVSRIVRGPYSSLWGYLALAIGLVLSAIIYYKAIGFLLIDNLSGAKILMYSIGIIDIVWLAWGSYRNFAKRELND